MLQNSILKLGDKTRVFLHTSKISATPFPNKHLLRWAQKIEQREGVKRGRIVNKTWGEDGQLPNRHSASDIDEALAKAQDITNEAMEAAGYR